MDDQGLRQSGPASIGADHGIAIVGCGAVAGTHLRAYTNAGLDVRVLCDIDIERARDRRDEYVPDADVAADHRTLIERDDIDVVDATLPPEPRVAVVEDALAAGKHVLSQKPFVTDLDTGRRLVALARRNGVHLAVNQNGRWAPGAALLRAAVDAGELGTVHSATVERTWDYSRIAGDDHPHRLLFHYAIHWIDLVRCVLPGEARTVHATTTRSPTQEPEQPVLGGILIGFDTAQATLTFDGDAHYGTVDRTRVIGDAGTVELSGPDPESRTVRFSGPDGTRRPSLSGSWNPTGWKGAMLELLATIEDGKRPSHDAADNLRTLELVFAAIESARTGESVAPGEITSLPP